MYFCEHDVEVVKKCTFFRILLGKLCELREYFHFLKYQQVVHTKTKVYFEYFKKKYPCYHGETPSNTVLLVVLKVISYFKSLKEIPLRFVISKNYW